MGEQSGETQPRWSPMPDLPLPDLVKDHSILKESHTVDAGIEGYLQAYPQPTIGEDVPEHPDLPDDVICSD